MTKLHVFWDAQVHLLTAAVPAAELGAGEYALELYDESNIAESKLRFTAILTRPRPDMGTMAVASLPTSELEGRRLRLILRSPIAASDLTNCVIKLNRTLNGKHGARVGSDFEWHVKGTASTIDLSIREIGPERPATATQLGEAPLMYAPWGGGASSVLSAVPVLVEKESLAPEGYLQEIRNGEWAPVHRVNALSKSIRVEVRFRRGDNGETPGVDLVFPKDVDREAVNKLRVSLAMVPLEEFVRQDQDRPQIDILHSRKELALKTQQDGTIFCNLPIDWSMYRPLSRLILMQSTSPSKDAVAAQGINIRNMIPTQPAANGDVRLVFVAAPERQGQGSYTDWLFAAAYYIDRLVPDPIFARAFSVDDTAPSAERMRNSWCSNETELFSLLPTAGANINYTAISLYSYRYAVKLFQAAEIAKLRSPLSFDAFLATPSAMHVVAALPRKKQLDALDSILKGNNDFIRIRVADICEGHPQLSKVVDAWWKEFSTRFAGPGEMASVLSLSSMPDVMRQVIRFGIFPSAQEHENLLVSIDDFVASHAECLEPPFQDAAVTGMHSDYGTFNERRDQFEQTLQPQRQRINRMRHHIAKVLAGDVETGFWSAINQSNISSPSDTLRFILSHGKHHIHAKADGEEDWPTAFYDVGDHLQELEGDGPAIRAVFEKTLVALRDILTDDLEKFGNSMLGLPNILLGLPHRDQRTAGSRATPGTLADPEAVVRILNACSDLYDFLPAKSLELLSGLYENYVPPNANYFGEGSEDQS